MKITFMLTWADAMGGTERAVFTQAERLAERHEVEVLSVFKRREELFFDIDPRIRLRFLIDATGPVPRPVRESGLDAATCQALAMSPSRLIDARWEKAFNRLSDLEVEQALRELDADVIVSTSPALMAVTTTLTASRVLTVHQEHRPSQLRGGTGEPLFQFAPRLDALVLLTERTGEWFAETLAGCAPRLEVIVNAVPAGFRPRSTRRTKTVTMARRLVPDKQVDHAIRAFAQVAAAHPDWTLRVFGDGPEENKLRRLINGLDLYDRVQLLGPTSHMDEEWAKSSIALLTSRDGEAFPLVLIEAFAAGLPAVSYDCQTGPAEIITHGENGFLVGQDDIDGLATAMIKLIEDEDLRDAFGEAALRASADYDIDVVMARWEELYARLLGERNDPRRVARKADRIAAWAVRTGGSGFAPAVPPPAMRLSTDSAADLEARIEATVSGLVRAGGRLCRQTGDRMPEDVTRANLEIVTDALRAADIPYFLVRDHGIRHRVAVRAEHRASALTALAAACADQPVYAEKLRPGGKASGVTLAALVRTDAADAVGLRVFEQVVTTSRTLSYGPAYGCDLEFWEQHGDDLIPVRRSLLGDVVPAAVMVPAPMTVGDREHPGVEALTRTLVADLDFPIDIVYTWVDGDDPAWLAKKNGTLAAGGPPPVDAAAGDARFRSRDELRYSLRSLEMFAPWARHIWLVTDDQVPAWLDTSHPKITVVDHKELFGDRGALPTFNSHAIESQLHHIDGLAEHFLYFNDDMFIGRPLHPSLFFQPSGLANFFLSPTSVAMTPVAPDDDFNFSAAKNNRRLIEDAFGHTLTHGFLHAPYSLRRSVLAEIEERFAAEIARTAAGQVRAHGDVSVPSSLHHYYGFFTGRSVPGLIRCMYANIGDPTQHPRLTQILTQRDYEVFCLNDTHHGELDAEEQARVVFSFLESYFPVPSSYETGSPRNRAL